MGQNEVVEQCALQMGEESGPWLWIGMQTVNHCGIATLAGFVSTFM